MRRGEPTPEGPIVVSTSRKLRGVRCSGPLAAPPLQRGKRSDGQDVVRRVKAVPPLLLSIEGGTAGFLHPHVARQ
jgi:hypothetical protein